MNADNVSGRVLKAKELLKPRPRTDIAPDVLERTEEHGNARRNVPPAAAAATILELRTNKVTFNAIEEATKGYIKKWEYDKHIDSLVKKFKIDEVDENVDADETEDKETFFKATPCRCNSWHCFDCRRVKGSHLRKILMEKSALFKVPCLFTFTINREWFKNPFEAHKYVMREKFISRLLQKEMNILRWVWVLEVQEKTGDGWPHWHILIDVGDLSGAWFHKESKIAQSERPVDVSGWCYIPHYFDLNKAHRLLRKWKVGEQCYLSERKSDFDSPKHAINYITTYFTKNPQKTLPAWMDFPRLKFYCGSRALGALSDTGNKKSDWIKLIPVDKIRKRRKAKLPSEKIAVCKKTLVFSFYDKQTGKMKYSQPVPATKELLLMYPSTSVIQDFDFEKQKSFDILGIKGFMNLVKFLNLCTNTKKMDHGFHSQEEP